MANIAKLKAELTDDPLARGYSGMTDQQVLDSLNEENRTVNRTSMTGSEVLNAVDQSEWNSRTDVQQQTVWNIVHLGDVNPFGIEAILITSAFSGAGGVTIAALASDRVNTVSRATELGIGNISGGNIAHARI
jgi:hypothetical protein